MNNTQPKTEKASAGKWRSWQKIVSVREGKVFIGGLVLVCLYLAAIALTSVWSADLSQSLLIMTGTHVLGGRAAGMSWGYLHELRPAVVIGVCMTIETFSVLLFYPLFVFSYHKLIIVQPLKETMARAQRAAEAYQPKIMKYGIPGLLLFVWFPFWMTGPLVGSIIGFLIGLRPWVNLSVVLSGTYVAIVCWSFVLQKIHERLRPLGPYVPFMFVGLILLLAISIHVRYAFSKHAGEPK